MLTESKVEINTDLVYQGLLGTIAISDGGQRLGGAFSVGMEEVGITDVKSLYSDRFLFGGLSGISVIMGHLHGLFMFSSSSDATWGRGRGATTVNRDNKHP